MPESQKAEETQTADATDAAASESATGEANDQVAGNDSPRNQQQSRSKGVDREFFKLREKKRELSSEVEQLRAQIEQLKAQGGSGTREGTDEDSTVADLKRELDAFKQSLVSEFEGREEAKRIAAEEHAADKWLMERQYVREDGAFADSVAALIHSKYAHIAQKDPRSAARLAYQDVCDLKGVYADMRDFSAEAKAGGGLGTSAPSVSKQPPSPKDFEAARKNFDFSTPEGRAAAKKWMEAHKG